jgi:thioredoxin 1
MIEATDDTFEAEVLKQQGLTLVKFGANWCMPCRMQAPILEALSENYRVVEVDVDDAPGLANEYEISGIPALLLFKDGVLVTKKMGLCSKVVIDQMIQDAG